MCSVSGSVLSGINAHSPFNAILEKNLNTHRILQAQLIHEEIYWLAFGAEFILVYLVSTKVTNPLRHFLLSDMIYMHVAP